MYGVHQLIIISVLLVVVGMGSSYVFKDSQPRSFRSPSTYTSTFRNGIKRPWGRSACYRPAYRNEYMNYGYRECEFPRDYPLETMLMTALSLGVGFPLYRRFRIKARANELKRRIEKLALTDPKWTEAFLHESAANKFMVLTEAWAKLDIETVRSLSHPTLAMEWEMQFQNTFEKGEYHELKGLSIESIDIVNFKNFVGENQDQFTACVHARVHDSFLRRGIILSASEEVYQEFWTFLWNPKIGWIPLQVHREDEWEKFVEGKVVSESQQTRKSS